jgi:hypothetical protein
MSVTRYHKTQSQRDVPKAVPRFMPWRVQQLVTVYLTYVQQLMERLSVAIGHGCGRSEYIWADANGPWDTCSDVTIPSEQLTQLGRPS